MYYVGNWRDRPRPLASSQFSVVNYCTDIRPKTDMKEYSDDIFKNLHLMPNPLRKNLADQFVGPELTKPEVHKEKMVPEPSQYESTLSGITNFISGVFNVLSSAMFKRPRTEENQQMASDWQPASKECKNGPPDHINLGNDIKKDMSDCRTAANNCEDKLSKVRLLLNARNPSSTVWVRSRPKRVFVDPNSIEEHFEDAFSPEDFINLANESYIEYYSPLQYQNPDYIEAESEKMRVQGKELNETIEIGMHLPDNDKDDKSHVPENVVNSNTISDTLLDGGSTNAVENVSDREIVSSCEDKLTKLKAMLQENRKNITKPHTIQTKGEKCSDTIKKPSDSIPIVKTKDKRFKNPNRICDKRKKSKQKQSIQDDLMFAYEVNLDQSSFEESPSFHSLEKIHEEASFSPTTHTADCFDEISGKFCTSNSSEDSFQIVFSDVPKTRRPSDCESEDSFIIFDDSPDSCYTSNDVFGDSESEESDSDSDYSDSGCGNIVLSAKLSRTFSNLTDNTLYDEDVVDFAHHLEDDKKSSSLLLDDKRKQLKKSLPPKKVHFSPGPPKVHVMRVWAFAARQARAGHWERYAVDRERFKRRIADVDMAVSWVLKPQHRSRVMFQRFMPWWNAQKRKELADKKAETEKNRLEAEKLAESQKQCTEDDKVDSKFDRKESDLGNGPLDCKYEDDNETNTGDSKEIVRRNVKYDRGKLNVENSDNFKDVDDNKNCTEEICERRSQSMTKLDRDKEHSSKNINTVHRKKKEKASLELGYSTLCTEEAH